MFGDTWFFKLFFKHCKWKIIEKIQGSSWCYLPPRRIFFFLVEDRWVWNKLLYSRASMRTGLSQVHSCSFSEGFGVPTESISYHGSSSLAGWDSQASCVFYKLWSTFQLPRWHFWFSKCLDGKSCTKCWAHFGGLPSLWNISPANSRCLTNLNASKLISLAPTRLSSCPTWRMVWNKLVGHCWKWDSYTII